MVNPIARFTSLTPAPSPASSTTATTPRRTPEAKAAGDGVEVRLSGQARALLEQIAAARGEAPAERPQQSTLGSRVDVVI